MTGEQEKPWSGIILLYVATGAPFWMGTLFAPAIGEYGQQILYAIGWFYLVFAILGTLLAWNMNPTEHDENGLIKEQLVKYATVVLMLLMVAVLFTSIVFTNDRMNNFTEEHCQEITHGSSLDRAVVSEMGQCIKNETGFHANGKAIFP